VFTGPAGTFAQTTGLTTAQKQIFGALDLTPPRKILHITPAADDTAAISDATASHATEAAAG
jgi:hypothetical protein